MIMDNNEALPGYVFNQEAIYEVCYRDTDSTAYRKTEIERPVHLTLAEWYLMAVEICNNLNAGRDFTKIMMGDLYKESPSDDSSEPELGPLLPMSEKINLEAINLLQHFYFVVSKYVSTSIDNKNHHFSAKAFFNTLDGESQYFSSNEFFNAVERVENFLKEKGAL